MCLFKVYGLEVMGRGGVNGGASLSEVLQASHYAKTALTTIRVKLETHVYHNYIQLYTVVRSVKPLCHTFYLDYLFRV